MGKVYELQLSGKVKENFDLWYDNYPRREAKLDAIRAWQQTKHLHPPIEQMLAILERHHEVWRGKEKQFLPLPATYLRAGRFMDEL